MSSINQAQGTQSAITLMETEKNRYNLSPNLGDNFNSKGTFGKLISIISPSLLFVAKEKKEGVEDSVQLRSVMDRVKQQDK